MNNIDSDILRELSYYKSGIKQLYLRNYQYYLFLLVAFMILTAVGIGITSFFLRVILFALLIIELYFGIKTIGYMRETNFEQYFEKIQQKVVKNFGNRVDVEEDAKYYYFSTDKNLRIKLSKGNTRNFPSKLEDCTLLVGFTTKFDKHTIEDPLYLFYYDITKIKQVQSYK